MFKNLRNHRLAIQGVYQKRLSSNQVLKKQPESDQ